MEPKSTALSFPYEEALRKHLKLASRPSLGVARALGRRAMALDLGTLDLARLHERALVGLELPGWSPEKKASIIRRAGLFFADTITPIERTHRTARETDQQLAQLQRTLRRRNVQLTASKRRLTREIAQRRTVEESLLNSEKYYGGLLEQSQLMQQQLRWLSRQLLSAQEEERQMITRELHDPIARTLTGIHTQLDSLKAEVTYRNQSFQAKISATQRLLKKSVDIVHGLARDLRPAVLDDLGLIPALHSFVKGLAASTGIRTHLTVIAAVEQLDSAKRTVLFRVAQEALTNVARHAGAGRVEVGIRKMGDHVRMQVRDDGQSFNVDDVLKANDGKCLGLLGMRERLEMLGGRLVVESAPGKGTNVLAFMPLGKALAGGGRKPAEGVR